MKISSEGLQTLKKLKGFKARPTKDTRGNLVIGYGHVVVPGDGVARGDLINRFKADELLDNDLFILQKKLDTRNIASQEQYDALVILNFMSDLEQTVH
jgi:GH24 family phage-related lysozyme (muramidase)